MAQPSTTVYANVVNFRLTPVEFVLEFGSHFPDRPGLAPPPDYKSDVRVVLPIGALKMMHAALGQAIQKREQQTAAKQQPTGLRAPNVDSESKP